MSTSITQPSVPQTGAGARGATKTEPTRVLNEDAGPLVWIDLEMTGLNVKKDEIMEIAVRIGSEVLGI